MRLTLPYLVVLLVIAILSAALPEIALAQQPPAQKEEPIAATTADPPKAVTRAKAELPRQVVNPQIGMKELDVRLVPLTKDELADLAAEWLTIVKSKTEEVMEAQVAIAKTEGAVADVTREKLTQIVKDRNALFAKYSHIVDAWEKKGGDKKAVAEYRAYRNSIIVEEARTTDLKTFMARVGSWLTDEDGGIALAKGIGVILVSFLCLLFAARIVRGIARRWIGHVPNLSKLLQAFLIAIIYWIVLAVGLMIVLSALGVDISPLFALIGGASFIIAFALQDTLGNLASGLMIMINRPFDEGDYVDVGGVAGTARSVSIVATTVVTPDNQVIVIPNKKVWGDIITNVTASETRRVDLVFGISYEDSIPEAIRVMEETVAAHPLVMKEPAPVIRVHELADSSVNFICRPWVQTSDYWTVYWDLMRQVKERFDEAGISIPYPQQDVHVKNGSPAPGHLQPSSQPVAKATAVRSDAVAFSAGDEGHEAEEPSG